MSGARARDPSTSCILIDATSGGMIQGPHLHLDTLRTVVNPNLLEWAGNSRATLAIVFTDIVGSTALLERVKDQRMSELLQTHFAQGDVVIRDHGGCRVKT